MTTSAQRQIGFPTESGCFVIEAESPGDALFQLRFFEAAREQAHDLGKYRSINDAITSVMRQETGYAAWDHLPTRELPYKIFDLACWNFKQFFGTKEPQLHSKLNVRTG